MALRVIDSSHEPMPALAPGALASDRQELIYLCALPVNTMGPKQSSVRRGASAREAVRVLNNQYPAGTVAYTSVIVAEQTALSDAETALTIRQNRLVASASLVQALGGGWNVLQLPNRDEIEQAAPLNFNPLPPIVPVQGR